LQKIGFRRWLGVNQIRKQIDKGEMMRSACAARPQALTAQGGAVGGQKQRMQLPLVLPDACHRCRDPGAPLRLKLREFRGNCGHSALPKLLSLLNHSTPTMNGTAPMARAA
jgi:hypothetical protein